MSRTWRRWTGGGALIALAIVALIVVTARISPQRRHRPEFVGSAACAKCHAAEFSAWKRSQHAVAMQDARPGTVLGRFDGTRFKFGDVASTFFRRGDRYFVNTEGADGKPHDFAIRYTFGVSPLQQYLVEFPGGRLQPLALAWDTRPAGAGGQRWFSLDSGPRVTHTDELHWTGRQQNWNYMCADCHSTGVRKGYDARTDTFHTTWSEINVSCEACHGPGSRHVDWAAYPRLLRRLVWRDDPLSARLDERRDVRWSIDSATGNARRNAPRRSDREIEACAQCHSRRTQIADGYTAGSPLLDFYLPSLIMPGLYFADGQQRAEVYTYASFLESRMYHAGVTCADCHDPHTQQLRRPGNAVCAQCHRAAKYDTTAHHFHRATSPGAMCVSCHMPATAYMQIDPRHDHSIRIPRPDQSVSLGVPNACSVCHSDRDAQWAATQIRAWYGTTPSGFQRFASAFAADERRTPSRSAADSLDAIASDSTEPPIVRASALIRVSQRPGTVEYQLARRSAFDADPLIRRSALQILEAFPAAQRVDVAAPLLRDTSRAVRIEAAWVMAPAASSLADTARRRAFASAAAEFIASQRANADRPENRTTLGTFFVELGQLDSAANEFRDALRLAPRFGDAYVNLADVYRAQGRESDAEQTLRIGLANTPNDAGIHHALGLALARTGRVPEAIAELERATRLAPDDATLAYAYAVALHTAHRVRDAIHVLDVARERHPEDHDLLFALATFHRDAGDSSDARRYARMLLESHPDDPQAQALVRSLGPGAPR